MTHARWYILKVAPNTEESVVASLTSFTTYVPMALVETFNRRMRVVKRVLRPMIPGFVFILLSEPWFFIKSNVISNVRGFLRNGDRSLAVLSDKNLNTLMEAEASCLMTPTKKKALPFKVGQILKVNGVLNGVLASVISISEKGLSLDWGGKAVYVTPKSYGTLEVVPNELRPV